MPFIKNSMDLLIEAAASDLKYNVSDAINESAVRSAYSKLESVHQFVKYSADMVPVVKVGDEFFTEMNFLAPYMRSNGVKSIAEALTNVSKANGLSENAVGLLVENDCSVSETMDKALAKGGKAKDAALAKQEKGLHIIQKLKDRGKNVKKKADDDDVETEDECDMPTKECKEGTCPKCGKSKSECTCK